MQKRTGIKIDFVHPAIGMEQEQFNLMMASGDLLDIISSANLYKGGEFQGFYDGFFRDLTQDIHIYAPDYWKTIQSDMEFFREVSDDDGRIPAFYAYKPLGDPEHERILLRKDILADLDKNIPRTITEYEDLFAAMLAKGIIPFMPAKNGYVQQFAGAFGILTGLYKNAQGKILYGQVQPEFRQYLELMNKWYSRGFISKDFTSVDSNQTNALFDTKRIGTFIGPIVANFNRGIMQGFEVTAAPYPRQKLGDKIHIAFYHGLNIWPLQGKGPMMAVVAAKSKYPEEAIRWLNYGYTKAGIELMNWGVEGINYNVVNGKNVYNDLMLNNPRFGTEEASYIYKMHFAPKYTELDTLVHANLLKSPASLASRFLWADDPDADSDFILPPYQTNAVEQSLKARVMTQISTYVDEMTLKFITGTDSLDRFDQFVSMVKSMGLDDLLKSEQGAYDRYMLKKMK
jgi:putative aldouronate transport system substrate-binding protein